MRDKSAKTDTKNRVLMWWRMRTESSRYDSKTFCILNSKYVSISNKDFKMSYPICFIV